MLKVKQGDNKMVNLEVMFQTYERYEDGLIRIGRAHGNDLKEALLNMVLRGRVGTYIFPEYSDEEDLADKTAEDILEELEAENGDGADYIFYIKDIDSGKYLFGENIEVEDWTYKPIAEVIDSDDEDDGYDDDDELDDEMPILDDIEDDEE